MADPFVNKVNALGLSDVPEAKPSSMYSTISALVDRTKAYAEEYSGYLNDALEKLADVPTFISGNIDVDLHNITIGDFPGANKPSYLNINSVAPFEIPEEPSLDNDLSVTLDDYEDAPELSFSEEEIRFNEIDAPEAFNAPALERAQSPGFSSSIIPVEEFVLSPIDSVVADEIQDDLVLAPIDTSEIDAFVFPNSNVELGEYISQIEPALIPVLLQELIEGSYGLTETVFNSIIDMELRKRNLIEVRDREKLLDTIGSDGFDLPQGILISALNEFDQVVTAKNHDTIDSTRVMSAELAQKNTESVRSLLLQAEQTFSQRFVSLEELKVKVASHFAETATAKFNALRERLLLNYEDVKIQIEKKKISIDIVVANNTSRFDKVKNDIERQKLSVDVVANKNGTSIEAAKAVATIEDINATIFKVIQSANVDAAQLELESLKTESDVYATRIDAERNRVGIELEIRKLNDERERLKTDIFNLQTSATSEKNNNLIQELQAKLSINDHKVKLFSAITSARGDNKKVELDIEGLKADLNNTLASIYDTETRAELAAYQGQIDKAKLILSRDTQVIQSELAKEGFRLQAFTSDQQLRQEGTKAHATLAVQSVASAWGVVNANLGYSYSGSEGVTANRSIHNNLSNSLQSSHSFKEQ